MYYHKIHHPVNFDFPSRWNSSAGEATIDGRRFRLKLRDLGDNVFRLQADGPGLQGKFSQAVLTPPSSGRSDALVRFDSLGTLEIVAPGGKTILSGVRGRTFGANAPAWIFQLVFHHDMRFYGMGEKNIGFERSGKQTKFWNTDVWADFDKMAFQYGITDPMYVSVPYMLIKQDHGCVGILVDNPSAVFMSTKHGEVRTAEHGDEPCTNFFFGAPDGECDVYFLVGRTVAEVTRRLQKLVGATPLPPLWTLGHQQSRWGYQSYDDMADLDREFRRHRIPNDGLWLDIDYMSGYRVFTVEKKNFRNPKKQLAELLKLGRRVVPILDPGVKDEKGYAVHDDGVKKNVFCQVRPGKNYIGFVWPGSTLFPDFSLPRVRAWWASHVKKFAQLGFGGSWLDMNDPAVGKIELEEMRFDNARKAHSTYHNQYALGMSQASHAGFLAARPKERPFLLARSGFISTSRYAAVWTGDNHSNRHHLRKSIEVSVNLALSGIPFNGPDVPGFGSDATADLAEDWYKAGFLFPFFRNHSIKGCRRQEPWQFGPQTLGIVRHYIQLRYKLLPYLYNLFIRQETTGEAILRPLFYDFANTPRVNLDKIDDQFLVGPAIMQAPLLGKDDKSRKVVLPTANWFDAQNGKWLRGNRTITVPRGQNSTPLYVREGNLIPMRPGTPTSNDTNLADVELHIFVRPGRRGEYSCEYAFDDGLSFDYRKGKRTEIRFTARAKGSVLEITAEGKNFGFGGCKVRPVVYGTWKKVVFVHRGRRRELALSPYRWLFAGKSISARMATAVRIDA